MLKSAFGYLRHGLALMVVALCTAAAPTAATAQVARADYVANPSLAINLDGIADWSTQNAFINIAKTARPWFGHLKGRWGGISNDQLRATGHVNDRGWPVAIPENATKLETLFFTDQPSDFLSNRGVYRLTYQGDVDIELSGRVKELRRRKGEIWFEFPASSPGTIGVGLTRINPDNPLTKLDIVHQSNIPAYEVGAIFNPIWLDRIKDFRVLRMMGWMATNDSSVRTWDDLPTTDDYSYTNGVPLEVMIDLANLVGADPWFTLPHQADDDLVRRFAQTVREKLNPNRKAYVEYSNETWNFQFQQTRWAGEQAKKLWGRKAGGDAWIQYAGLRAAQIAIIFRDVFGPQADTRLVNVIAVHTAWPDLAEAQLAGRLLKSAGAHDPAKVFDAYAVTGYLRPDFPTGQTTATLKSWLAEGGKQHVFNRLTQTIRDTRLKNLSQDFWPAHALRARKYGLDMIMYEGGTHVILPYDEPADDGLIALLTEYNYSAQMAALYRETFTAWRRAGGHLFNAFVDVSQPSRWGSWGNLRHLDDDTARWAALIKENAKPDEFDQNRLATDFGQGVLGASSETATPKGTAFNDILIGGAGDDSFAVTQGQDRINGGEGFDQLVFPGRIDDIHFQKTRDLIVATGPDFQTIFTGIEYLVFPKDGLAIAPLDAITARDP